MRLVVLLFLLCPGLTGIGFFDRPEMEYRHGRFRKAREDEQPSDIEDQKQYALEAAGEFGARVMPGGPYPRSPLYQGLELPLPDTYPRLCPGEMEIGELGAGTSLYTQSFMCRASEIGATPSYPAGRDPLRLDPGYHLRPGEVTKDQSATTRTLHARPPAFQGPKIGGAQPLYSVPPLSTPSQTAPRQTSCDRLCGLDRHVNHQNCDRECKTSGHAAHVERDRLWRERQRFMCNVGMQT